MTYPTFSKVSMSKKCLTLTLGYFPFIMTSTSRMVMGAGLVIRIGESSSDEAEGGLFLKSDATWITWVWFYFLVIASVSRSF